jgi:hypothetical protein
MLQEGRARDCAAAAAAAAAAEAAHQQRVSEAKEAAAVVEAALCDQLAEAQARWEAQEPRKEDVARISDLEAAVCERGAALQAAQARLGQLRGEMLLREETYNKRFSNGGAGARVLDVEAALGAEQGVLDWMLKGAGAGAAAAAGGNGGGGNAKPRPKVGGQAVAATRQEGVEVASARARRSVADVAVRSGSGGGGGGGGGRRTTAEALSAAASRRSTANAPGVRDTAGKR